MTICFFKNSSHKYKIFLLLTLLLIGGVLHGGLVFAADELPSPTITINPDIYYPLDEILYLEGRSKPNLTVSIQFSKQGTKPLKFAAKSDANGEWVLAEKVPLEAGDWEVRARLLGQKDAASDWSNPRVFKVIVSGIMIGNFNIKFAALTFFLVISLVLTAMIVAYFTQRIRQLRLQLVSKEVRETQESVHKGLSDIREHLFEELNHPESSEKHAEANHNEGGFEHREHVLKDLERVEQNIEKEIEDVEDKLRS